MATIERTRFQKTVDGLTLETRAFIDGEYADAASGATFDCISPITGQSIGRVAACDAADVDRAVAVARRVFETGTWSRLAPKKRKKVLVRFAELIAGASDELALLETLDERVSPAFAHDKRGGEDDSWIYAYDARNVGALPPKRLGPWEIGRASCRERV